MVRVIQGAASGIAWMTCIAFVVAAPEWPQAEDRNIKIVGNDRGGYIGARAIEVAELNASGTRIELRGDVCLSSCTMYLGVDDMCLLPGTIFGFHGPSRHGRALPQAQFEHWSQIMAQHYHPALQTWFLQDARHATSGYKRISGRQLISIGYPAC